jgi:hypothetical protein
LEKPNKYFIIFTLIIFISISCDDSSNSKEESPHELVGCWATYFKGYGYDKYLINFVDNSNVKITKDFIVLEDTTILYSNIDQTISLFWDEIGKDSIIFYTNNPSEKFQKEFLGEWYYVDYSDIGSWESDYALLFARFESKIDIDEEGFTINDDMFFIWRAKECPIEIIPNTMTVDIAGLLTRANNIV